MSHLCFSVAEGLQPSDNKPHIPSSLCFIEKMSVQEVDGSLLKQFPIIEKKGKGEEGELNYIKRRLSKKKKKFPEQSNTAAAPKRILSPEIAKLTSQINDKLNPTNFSQETHFSKSDPRYGTPQVSSIYNLQLLIHPSVTMVEFYKLFLEGFNKLQVDNRKLNYT